MGKRYRYIAASAIMPRDRICKFRLFSAKYLNVVGKNNHILVRVELPDNVKMLKDLFGTYTQTNDIRRIMDFNYDVIVRINRKWVVKNELKPDKPNQTIASNRRYILNQRDGLMETNFGYVSHTYFEKECL